MERFNSVAAEESKQNLNNVTNSIQKTLGILHHLSGSSFDGGATASHLPLLHHLNILVSEFEKMSEFAEMCNIQVPAEVLNLIDDGKNPDEFTRDVLNSCVAKNQVTKGKTDAIKGLRKNMLEELEEAFPQEVEAFRLSRSETLHC